MIKSVSERQDAIILHILFSDYYVIYSIYTTSISAKWPNIGTVFEQLYFKDIVFTAIYVIMSIVFTAVFMERI
jgi:hypothetical protein